VIDYVVEMPRMGRLMSGVRWEVVGKVDRATNLARNEDTAGTEQASHFLEERWIIRNL
jgi:hypothetical protein